MSLYLDHKYASQVSSRLEKFKRKSQRIYNFRCPICKDSAKSKIKARGYFYTQQSNLKFHCHNCLVDWTFSHFLQEFAPDIFQEYVFEKYKETGIKEETYNEFDFKPHFAENINDNDNILFNCSSIDSLGTNHFAYQYIQQRKIPKDFWEDIWYTSDFKKIVDKFEPKNEYELKPDDPRIIFPFRNQKKRITAIQGRSLQKGGLRYITIKVDHDAPKIFGLDRVNPPNRVYVVEGPIDSFFLPNSIACAGSDLSPKHLSFCNDLVFVFDAEQRNNQLIEKMKRLADSGSKICVWPEDMPGKDINDFVLAGKTSENIIDIINANTYTGLSARIALNEWKRI